MTTSFLKSVCKKYHLGQLKSWSKIPKGLINTKILLKTTKGNFVVRISARPKRQLAFEVALLNLLKSLPVAQLMSFAKNKYISTYKQRPYIVYKYIEGDNPQKISSSLIKQIGRFQANFHRLGKNFHYQISREPYTYNFPSIVFHY